MLWLMMTPRAIIVPSRHTPFETVTYKQFGDESAVTLPGE
jgi:hypothetical protein